MKPKTLQHIIMEPVSEIIAEGRQYACLSSDQY